MADRVAKGHEKSMELVVSLLKKFELPLGLLHLKNVQEAGYRKDTGDAKHVWITQPKVMDKSIPNRNSVISYGVKIEGTFQNKKIKNLKGVKYAGTPMKSIEVENAGQIIFRDDAGVKHRFPVAAFAARN